MNIPAFPSILLAIGAGTLVVASFMAALYITVRKRQVIKEYTRKKDANILPDLQSYRRP